MFIMVFVVVVKLKLCPSSSRCCHNARLERRFLEQLPCVVKVVYEFVTRKTTEGLDALTPW